MEVRERQERRLIDVAYGVVDVLVDNRGRPACILEVNDKGKVTGLRIACVIERTMEVVVVIAIKSLSFAETVHVVSDCQMSCTNMED